MNLTALSHTIFQGNKEKGFWDKPRNVGEMLMLVTSELAEALEADRKGRRCLIGARKHFINSQFDQNAPALSNDVFVQQFSEHVKDTFEDEIADAIIRILDLCGGMGIDIEAHVELKLKYNAGRPRLHGKLY